MAIENGVIEIQYAANGSQKVFTYPFKVDLDSEVRVIVTTSGVDSVKSLGTDYSVSGVGNAAGGEITFVTAPAAGTRVTIKLDMSFTQGLELTENDALPAEPLEAALDRNVRMAQQLKALMDRAPKFAEGSTFKGVAFPELVPNRVLKVNAAGTGLEMSSTDLDSVVANLNASVATAANNAAVSAVAAVQTNLTALSNTVTSGVATVQLAQADVTASRTTVQNAQADVTSKLSSVQTIYNNAITTKNDIALLEQQTVAASIAALSAAQAAEGLIDSVGNPEKYYFKQRLLNIW
jgi:hypothetical protein